MDSFDDGESKRTGLSGAGLVLLIFTAVVVLAVLSFVALPFLMHGTLHRPEVRLVYEVDPSSTSDGHAVDMSALVDKIDSRVNRRSDIVRVRDLSGGRIEVAVYSGDSAVADRVDRLIRASEALELRILADRRDDKEIIDRALADSSRAEILDSKGTVLARWLPIDARQEQIIANYRDIALRKKKSGAREVTEVLVLNDDYNITGAYVSRASPSVDERGRPCIDLAFNKFGGELLRLMTTSHMPDETTGTDYKMAIILSGKIRSAPAIKGTIRNRAQVTGSFTQQEVLDLVDVLNSGELSAKLRLVEDHR
jgi:SecD/SecF fusion protein